LGNSQEGNSFFHHLVEVEAVLRQEQQAAGLTIEAMVDTTEWLWKNVKVESLGFESLLCFVPFEGRETELINQEAKV